MWWRGSCGHVWREKVSMRSMRVDDSCPYCKNRKLLRGFNDLATTHPELVAEWDFERNGDLGPDRRDRQLQQARLVEVQGEPRVVRPHSEPGAQGQGGPGLSVLLGTQGARRLQRPGHHASQHSGHVAPAHEQAPEAHRRAGHKPQARMVARRVRPRLPDGRPRQGEGQAGLLPVLFGEEEARGADKARLALGPSARKERGRRRCLLPIGMVLRILDWAAMRGGYGGPHRFRWLDYVCVDADAKNRPIGNLPQWDDLLSDLEAAFRSWFIVDDGRNEPQKSGGSNSRKQVVRLSSRIISAGNLVFSS